MAGQRSKVKTIFLLPLLRTTLEREVRCGKVESDHRSSRNPTGRPGNQWKPSFLKSGPREAMGCGKVESEHRSSRNPISRPGNQWKSSFLKSFLHGEEGHMKKISLFVCGGGRSTVRLQEKRSDLLVFVRHLRQDKGD